MVLKHSSKQQKAAGSSVPKATATKPSSFCDGHVEYQTEYIVAAVEHFFIDLLNSYLKKKIICFL